MLFRGKKGAMDEEIQKFLFIAVIFVAVVLTMFIYVKNAVEDTEFVKEYYARDIALLIDSVSTNPGNSRLNYTIENRYQGDFDIIIKEGKVSVFTKGEKTNPHVNHYSLNSITEEIDSELLQAQMLILRKKDGKITIQDN